MPVPCAAGSSQSLRRPRCSSATCSISLIIIITGSLMPPRRALTHASKPLRPMRAAFVPSKTSESESSSSLANSISALLKIPRKIPKKLFTPKVDFHLEAKSNGNGSRDFSGYGSQQARDKRQSYGNRKGGKSYRVELFHREECAALERNIIDSRVRRS